MMLRLFDFVLAVVGLLLAGPLMAMLYLIGLWDTGAPLFKQVRVGQHMRPFALYKFRTMRPDTASIATHLVDATSVTPLGLFLRRTKLDELPQLWNVVKGEMSIVGPRPCLFNQQELIDERNKYGVFDVRPGITGLAQVRGIDMSTPRLLAEIDKQMVESLNSKNYIHLLLATLAGAGRGDRTKGAPK
jgi:lipopolysaccharide/colanic/teichoic acid biosynthesis glycosyltransferase